jgi:hypothetical protein
MRGVDFRMWISPRIRSQNRNGLKGSVMDLGQSDLCKNIGKTGSLSCPFKLSAKWQRCDFRAVNNCQFVAKMSFSGQLLATLQICHFQSKYEPEASKRFICQSNYELWPYYKDIIRAALNCMQHCKFVIVRATFTCQHLQDVTVR